MALMILIHWRKWPRHLLWTLVITKSKLKILTVQQKKVMVCSIVTAGQGIFTAIDETRLQSQVVQGFKSNSSKMMGSRSTICWMSCFNTGWFIYMVILPCQESVGLIQVKTFSEDILIPPNPQIRKTITSVNGSNQKHPQGMVNWIKRRLHLNFLLISIYVLVKMGTTAFHAVAQENLEFWIWWHLD